MAVKRSRILVAVAAVAVIGGIVAFDVIKDRAHARRRPDRESGSARPDGYRLGVW